LAVWLVADFEALPYQVTTTFDMSCAARIRTAPAINYTACYRLVFFIFCHFFYQFATSFLSAVRLGRQALWLVLVVRWLFERPANVLDYEAWAIL